MKYIAKYNARLGKITYVKPRTNHSGLVLFGLVSLSTFIMSGYKPAEPVKLVSPIPDMVVQAKEVEKPILPTPTVFDARTQGCIKNHPDVAKALEETFEDQYPSAVKLFCRESSLRPDAVNPTSGACGLVQALPCAKLEKECPSMGLDCQVKWGVRYLENRYGGAKQGWEFWQKHHWY